MLHTDPEVLLAAKRLAPNEKINVAGIGVGSQGGSDIDGVRSCSDPISDFIGVIWQDSGSDVNVSIWNGTEIVTGGPLEDNVTSNAGAFTTNVDCAWINDTTALFGFINSSTPAMSYAFFHKPNTWSVSDLSASPATVDIASSILACDFLNIRSPAS